MARSDPTHPIPPSTAISAGTGSRTQMARPAGNTRVKLDLMSGAYAPWPAEDLPECLQSSPILPRPLRHPAQNVPEARIAAQRSEEHTSELQSLRHLVCR